MLITLIDRNWVPVVLAMTLAFAAAQSDLCFYPNGNWAVDNQAPCTTTGGNCCPVAWECLSNGLCHNPHANLTGRYACTDRSWQSRQCTQICTNSNQAIGDENILQCEDGTYCCNGDGSLHCCDHQGDSDYHFFDLPFGSVISSITSARTSNPSLAPVTNSAASFTDGIPLSSPQTSSTLSHTTTSSTPTLNSPTSVPSTTAASSTSFLASSSFITSAFTSTGSDGRPYVTTEVSRMTITSVASASDQHNGTSAQTLGLAVGLSVGLVALGALCLAFFFWRRHRQSPADDVRAHYTDDNAYGHFPPEGRAPEADSYPVADTESRQNELPGSVPGFGGVSPAPPTYSSPVIGEKVELDSRQVIPAVNSGNPFELDGGSAPLASSRKRT